MSQFEDQNTTWAEEENESKNLYKKVILIAVSIFVITLSAILFFLSSGGTKIEGEELKAHVLEEVGLHADHEEGHGDSHGDDHGNTHEDNPSDENSEIIEEQDVTKEEIIPEEDDVFTEEGEFVFNNELYETYSEEKIEEIYRKLLEDTQEPIIAMDTGAVIKYVSEEYTNLTGFKPDELKEKTFFKHINPEDLESTLSSITQMSIKGTANKIGPYRIKTKNGTTQMHIANAIIIKNKEDKPAQIVIAIQNVSDKISGLPK